LSLDAENVEKLKEILRKENLNLSVFLDCLIEEYLLNWEVKKYGILGKSSQKDNQTTS
jgi:hypothetical protein